MRSAAAVLGRELRLALRSGGGAGLGLAFFLVGRALFGAVPSLFDHFVIVPLVLFTTAVPLPFGALGLTEGVSGRLFDLVNHPGGAVAMRSGPGNVAGRGRVRRPSSTP